MAKIKVKNLYSPLAQARSNEIFNILLRKKGLRIERIVSRGQATPKGKWLSQKKDEWVILLRGRAKICFKKDARVLSMKEGDYIFIPAGARHRVAWTVPGARSVWLAIHC